MLHPVTELQGDDLTVEEALSDVELPEHITVREVTEEGHGDLVHGASEIELGLLQGCQTSTTVLQ